MSIYPVMRFIGLGTCCECPDSWWCPVTGWTELGSSRARHLAGQGDPSSGVLVAPPRHFSPVLSPPPSSELKIAVWSLFLIFKERVDKCFIYSGFLHTWWSFGSSKPTSFVTTWETVTSGLFFFPPSPALVTNSLCFSNSVSSMDFPLFYTSSLSTPTPKCAVSAWSDPGTPHPSILCALTDVPVGACTHTQGENGELVYILLNRLDTHLGHFPGTYWLLRNTGYIVMMGCERTRVLCLPQRWAPRPPPLGSCSSRGLTRPGVALSACRAFTSLLQSARPNSHLRTHSSDMWQVNTRWCHCPAGWARVHSVRGSEKG